MKLRFLSFALIIFTVISMVGCASSNEESDLPEESLAIDISEVSGFKWVCREADMVFYTLDFGSTTVIGKYTKDGKDFRLVGKLDPYGMLDFGFYDSEDVGSAPVAHGFLYASYVYENDLMVCSVSGLDGIEFDKTALTFEKSEINKTVKETLKCNEVDMVMSSFNEIDGYYKGEIVIDGKTCGFMAYEVCSGQYRFHIENGKVNDLTEGVSPLIDITLTEKDGQLSGSVSNTTIEDKDSFPYWDFEKTSLSFNKQ